MVVRIVLSFRAFALEHTRHLVAYMEGIQSGFVFNNHKRPEESHEPGFFKVILFRVTLIRC